MTTPKQTTAAQTVDLKTYFDMRLSLLETVLAERFTSQGEAIKVANAANERRLDLLNEFREAMQGQSDSFVTKVQFEAFEKRFEETILRLEEDVKSLTLSRAVLEGKASQSAVNVALAFSLVGMAISIIGLLLKFAGM